MVRRRLCDALGGEPDPLAAQPLVQGVKQNGHFPPAAARAAGQSNVRGGEPRPIGGTTAMGGEAYSTLPMERRLRRGLRSIRGDPFRPALRRGCVKTRRISAAGRAAAKLFAIFRL
jgi:hypothetical protein